ncbi:glutamine--fructose-6-phosphate transaminase (isomerizing) [Vibrio vulnificus]|uniref:glutamine--fructose-6-phosphate transaminase (isomerizing) n=1 Tax=Vibrio vulnificus TaxID=672 RepID=UPI00165E7D38|nr:glutamine--fructose-6-phosphate transaminase (isomerizing) [Vibrio vulnificus]EHS1183804.1 glutamine--fructose-6-phosphate transaminase (isomerizing) [Vibrio vulnificus]EHY9867196.1 glutamine--fructose-6-phosphate transaminase (isomerizing) [Vibrio vulnificus]EIC2758244.1 glutamine--fructose-6-phosphate transaminase (isomerizing) [Vibrio vulnificus]EJO3993607.1 glutamine--fructose-6-phosphate transaminase (isomerizing) [Vibrio vulnificus]ELP5730248.1 glutamine--fructose-6-phosphate transami
MCGIVGAVAQRDVAEILVEGLRRLEYRGYDSAGVAVVDSQSNLTRIRRLGKVQELADAVEQAEVVGGTGIAHTRWATHGEPSEINAHPHQSGDISVVHNGIIENHETLRELLQSRGYVFESQTDTEVIAHLVEWELRTTASLLEAVQKTVKQLEGAYGTVVLDRKDPSRLVVARSGSPLVIGYGMKEHFIASDQLALLPVTRRFAFLEEGDVAEVTRFAVSIFDAQGNQVEREIKESEVSHDAGDKGEYRHYMLKEIYEQPVAIQRTLEGRLANGQVVSSAFGENAETLLSQVKHVQIIACGTSYHAGLVARYWLEEWAGVSCNVEIASEFRYRKSHVFENSLLVTISQSGETADTLAALRLAKEMGYMASLTICNVPGSSLVRESDMAYMMKAGAEIGVASTKAFTVQLAGLLMLAGAIGRHNGMSQEQQASLVSSLQSLPAKIEQTLSMAESIEELAEDFADKHHSLFLGRGEQSAIAMEGALKLKEISYIHAEAYAAGELKHGPLALIDAEMPVIVVAPNNELLEKLKSNVEEVRARGGLMYVFADVNASFESDETMKVLNVPHCDPFIAPIVYTLPLQLLSYYVALIKGTDVDQPRNLAKSVTVE